MELCIHRKKSKLVTPENVGGRNIKWSNETRLIIAHYVHENYLTFKALGDTGGRKMDFLRRMRDILQLQCTDKQLKNGFESIIRKYKMLRDKLNGFERHSDERSVEKESIMQQCPYFEVLDQVMGMEPDVSPPFTMSSASFGSVADTVELTTDVVPTPPFTYSGSSCGTNADSNDVPPISVSQPFICDGSLSETDEKINTSQLCDLDANEESFRDEDVKTHMNITVQRIPNPTGTKKKKNEVPKNAIGAFAAIVSKNCEVLRQVEANKLKLETEKFLYSKFLDRKKFEAEHLAQQFELEKIRVQGEIEIQKLRLQIELEKLRSTRQQTPP